MRNAYVLVVTAYAQAAERRRAGEPRVGRVGHVGCLFVAFVAIGLDMYAVTVLSSLPRATTCCEHVPISLFRPGGQGEAGLQATLFIV